MQAFIAKAEGWVSNSPLTKLSSACLLTIIRIDMVHAIITHTQPIVTDFDSILNSGVVEDSFDLANHSFEFMFSLLDTEQGSLDSALRIAGLPKLLRLVAVSVDAIHGGKSFPPNTSKAFAQSLKAFNESNSATITGSMSAPARSFGLGIHILHTMIAKRSPPGQGRNEDLADLIYGLMRQTPASVWLQLQALKAWISMTAMLATTDVTKRAFFAALLGKGVHDMGLAKLAGVKRLMLEHLAMTQILRCWTGHKTSTESFRNKSTNDILRTMPADVSDSTWTERGEPNLPSANHFQDAPSSISTAEPAEEQKKATSSPQSVEDMQSGDQVFYRAMFFLDKPTGF